MKNKIDALINLVTELTKSVITDETKKIEMMQQMKSIKEVEQNNANDVEQVIPVVNINDQLSTSQVKQLKTNDSNKSNRNNANKRKTYSKKTTPFHTITNNAETTGLIEYLVRWYDDENLSKKSKLNNENNEQHTGS